MNRRRGALPGQLSLPVLLHELAALGLPATRTRGGCGRLGEWDRAVLQFAAEHHLSGRYAKRVQQHLGCSPVRRLQAPADVLDHPAALAAHPELVGRLRVLRARRRRLQELTRTATATATPAAPGSGGERR